MIKTREVAGGGGKMESRSDVKDKDKADLISKDKNKSDLRPKNVKNTKQ